MPRRAPLVAALLLQAGATTAKDFDVILYGAYGCVGHLAAFHLAQQPNLRWAIAGRNATKLAALAAFALKVGPEL